MAKKINFCFLVILVFLSLVSHGGGGDEGIVVAANDLAQDSVDSFAIPAIIEFGGWHASEHAQETNRSFDGDSYLYLYWLDNPDLDAVLAQTDFENWKIQWK